MSADNPNLVTRRDAQASNGILGYASPMGTARAGRLFRRAIVSAVSPMSASVALLGIIHLTRWEWLILPGIAIAIAGTYLIVVGLNDVEQGLHEWRLAAGSSRALRWRAAWVYLLLFANFPVGLGCACMALIWMPPAF